MSSNSTSIGDLLKLLYREGHRRVLTLSWLFALVALVALGVGLSMPKKFDASNVLIAETNSVIKPLMEGRGVTGIAEQTAILAQVMEGKRIQREVLIFGGWVKPPPAKQPDPREEERLLQRLKSRIRIDSPREGLIRISYHDTDPQRTYKIANKLAEIYMRESTATRERESREAFEFIDKQVKEYGTKLTDFHQQVLAQYRSQDARPGLAPTPSPTPGPTPAPRPAARISAEELAELRAEEATLVAQLRKQAPKPPTGNDNKQTEEQLRNRALQIQGELDKLMATYTEEHPDVRRVRRELATAKGELRRVEAARAERDVEASAAARAAAKLDDDVSRAANHRLEEVRRRIAAAGARPSSSASRAVAAREKAADDKLDPEMRGIVRDTTLLELLRRYEATRDVYQDLLKRRENARVSMELEEQHRAFNLRVQEPAEVPVTATSLRLVHLSVIGLILAALVPIGFLFAIVRLDRRVRSSQQIELLAKVPLLISISFAPAKAERSHHRKRELLAAAMVATVFVVYGAAFVIRLTTTS